MAKGYKSEVQADSNVTKVQKGNVSEPNLPQPYKAPNEGPGGGGKPIRGQSSSGLGMGPGWDEYSYIDTPEKMPPGQGATANTGKWPASGSKRLEFPEGGSKTR